MERIAKSATVATSIETPTFTKTEGTLLYKEVPIDVFRAFEMEMSKVNDREIDRLKDIFSWAKKDSETLGDAMQKISRLEHQLGSPAIGETRYNKIWLWVKLQNQKDDLDKRQDTLRKRWLI